MEANIYNLSKAFALRVIRLYQYLQKSNEFVMSKQVLRSGTSIGANVKEAKNAQSKSDFISKMNIALKEADETVYWLELLHESGYIDDAQFASINEDSQHIVATLINIVKTSKKQ